MSAFQVLIVDDHPVVLAGLRILLSTDTRFAICAEACTVAAAREAARRCRPDLIVTDLVLGGEDGVSLVKGLAEDSSAAGIVVYSSLDEALWGRLARRAGARGYVSKAEPLDTVARALEVVSGDDCYFSATIAADGPSWSALDLASLSPREQQILRLMGEARSLQDMGAGLGVSVKTIGSYRERLKTKLGFDSLRTLERFAIEHALGRAALR